MNSEDGPDGGQGSVKWDERLGLGCWRTDKERQRRDESWRESLEDMKRKGLKLFQVYFLCVPTLLCIHLRKVLIHVYGFEREKSNKSSLYCVTDFRAWDFKPKHRTETETITLEPSIKDSRVKRINLLLLLFSGDVFRRTPKLYNHKHNYIFMN